MGEITTQSRIIKLSRQYRASNKTIVFTNGCFDILHAGHVKYLSLASGFGDILILGLNSDRSQDHRSVVMAQLSCIDHVVLFDEPDPEQLIESICPDVLVKGADWPEDQIIGANFVKLNGGRIERVRLEPDISTTKIIERIGELYYGKH